MAYQSSAHIKKIEKIAKALANEKRLSILKLIRKEKKLAVWQISSKLDLPFKSVSRDLLTLERAQILSSYRDSVENYYSLNEKIPRTIKNLISHL